MVPPCSDRISRVPPYSRTHRTGRIRGCHPLRPAFPDHSAYTRQATGLFRFRSPLLAESLLMSFPPGTEMFQFPGFASPAYVFSGRYPLPGGLPHSDIHGSKPARGSPWLLAACHVLHRLLVPRHPPNALISRDHQTRSSRTRPRPPCTATIHTPSPGSFHPRHRRGGRHADQPAISHTHTLPQDQTARHRPIPNASERSTTTAGRCAGRNKPTLTLAGQTSRQRHAQRRTRTRFTLTKTTTPRHHNATPHRHRQTTPLAGQRQTAPNCMLPVTISLGATRAVGTPLKPPPNWWRRSESNRRPPACKAGALPAELRPPAPPSAFSPQPSDNKPRWQDRHSRKLAPDTPARPTPRSFQRPPTAY